jgi:hypothetical protein
MSNVEIRQSQSGLSFFLMTRKLCIENANNWNWLKVIIHLSDKKAAYCCVVIN